MDHSRDTTRRTFLGATAATVAGLSAMSSTAAGANSNAMQTQRVRRSIGSLDLTIPADKQVLDQYTEGVRVLLARSAANPADQRGWGVQAGLHTYRCQHGNWWFLPWHRAYLYYFEKMIQDAVGDSTFALPYWDWTDNAQLTLPAAFQTVGSPLYDARRLAQINDGSLGIDWSFYNYYYGNVMNYILGLTTFVPSFGSSAAGTFAGLQSSHGTEYPHGDLEGGPHDSVHGSIGGSGQPDMGNPTYAALDPIFWLHHANIDRLWSRWRAASPSTHTNPTDPTWINQQFEFIKPDGTLELIGVGQVINSWDTPLGYRYDDEAAPPAPVIVAMAAPLFMIQEAPMLMPNTPPGQVTTVAETRFEVADKPLTVSLKVNPKSHAAINQALAVPIDAAPPKAGPPARVLLLIEGIEFGAKASGVVEVYLNAPEMEEGKRPEKQHVVGTFTFFTGHPPMPQPMMINMDGEAKAKTMPATPSFDRVFDISETVRALQAAGKWNVDDVKVSLIRRSFDPKAPIEGKVSFQRAEVQVATAP